MLHITITSVKWFHRVKNDGVKEVWKQLQFAGKGKSEGYKKSVHLGRTEEERTIKRIHGMK